MTQKRLIAFGAHPGCIEMGAGGTIAHLVQNKNFDAHHVLVTSGEAGCQKTPKEELKALREKEAKQSADVLGVKHVHFMEAPDGLTHYTQELRLKIIELIRSIQPEAIFVHSSFEKFPDHRLTHDLVMSAIAGAAGPWFQETKEAPFSPKYIFGYELWNPMPNFQHPVDITKVIDKKIDALKCYTSQNGAIAYDDAFKNLAGYRGIMACQNTYGEVFEVIKM